MFDCANEFLTLINYLTAGNFFGPVPESNTLTLTLAGLSLLSIGTAWTKRWL